MVEIVESSLVVPSDETPNETIWLSGFDLLLAGSVYTTNITLFRHNGGLNFFSVEVLRAALAKALVYFYPFAGRLVLDDNGRPEIKCTGEGARFIVAKSTYTVDDIILSPSKIGNELVPMVQSIETPFILITLQVNFLKCGGVCLGVGMHHSSCDGKGALHFINTWAKIAKGIHDPWSLDLSFDRTILKARTPPTILYNYAAEYNIKTKNKTTETVIIETKCEIQVESFKISTQQLQSLKNQLNDNPTTFKALMAHLWRWICKIRAQDGEENEETRLFIVVDIRNRIVKKLPEGYFGNALVQTTAKASVAELLSNSIQYAADKIDEAIIRASEEEYIRSAIDFIEELDLLKYSKKVNGKLDCRKGMKHDIFAVSWLQLPTKETDFGWGKPALMAKTQIHSDGLVYLSKSLEGDEGIILTMSLKMEAMMKFKNLLSEELFNLS